MTLDALAAEIASQAEAKARSIIEEAKAEAARIEDDARNQAQRLLRLQRPVPPGKASNSQLKLWLQRGKPTRKEP